MGWTAFDFSYFLLVLSAFLSFWGSAKDDSEADGLVEYRYEIATSPDAHMVYEDTHYFEIISPKSLSYTFKLRQAKDFGGNFDREYKKIRMVIAEPVEACRTLKYRVDNAVALVLRGGCSFLTKSKIAEGAGAIAVIIADSDFENDDHLVDMVDDATGRKVEIPSMFLMGKDGVMIRRNLNLQGLNEAIINIPVNLSGVAVGNARQPPWTLW